MIDLHSHSIQSDGTDAPVALPGIMQSAGLTGFALTDHDTTAGWEGAAKAPPGGMTLIRGAEISCERRQGGAIIALHLLAYLFDPDEPELAAELARIRDSRATRADAMIDRLGELGAPLDPARVNEIAGPAAIARPHIARAMVERGYIPDIAAAFTTEWIGDRGRAYVPKYALDPAAAVRLVRGAGGVAVVAHPRGRSAPVTDELIAELAQLGLAGIEIDHPDHDETARRELARVADRLGLIATGGSDYHGQNKTVVPGAYGVRPDTVAALAAHATGCEVIVR